MWGLLSRTPLVNLIAYVTFPVAVVVGVLGYHAERWLRPPGKPPTRPSVMDARDERELRELREQQRRGAEASQHTVAPS